MANESPDAQHGGHTSATTTFNDLKKEIAERNERAHKEARELRATRERKELGIVTRNRVDLER